MDSAYIVMWTAKNAGNKQKSFSAENMWFL